MPRLQVQLERPSYSPGETVRAWARAIDGGDSRGGVGLLRYVERTEDYTDVAWQAEAPLWSGAIVPEQSWAFELTLPPDAKPGFAGKHGSLSWEVLVKSDEFGRDSIAAQQLELLPPAGGYPVPSAPQAATGAPARVKGLYYATPAVAGGAGYALARIPGAVAGAVLAGGSAVLSWRRQAQHFALDPLPPVRRGQSVRATVRMIDAAKVQGELEAALRCVERYDYRSQSSNRSGSSRRTAEETLHVERVPMSQSQRSVDIEVPAQLPFSHSGSCLAYAWTLVVQEKRENATDRVAEQPLLVLP